MTEITTKAFLQSQTGANAGLFHDMTFKQAFQNLVKEVSENGIIETAEKSAQQITATGTFGAGTNSGRQNGSENQQDRKSSFTVMIRDRSGEQRVITLKSASAETAKHAAQSNLEDGEEITAVNKSTLPDAPDPNRGLVA